MSTQQSQPANRNRRVATREELTRFYAAIGIPAVISAMQANKMQAVLKNAHADAGKAELPAFLKEALPLSST